MDGYSYGSCTFENVTFVYNGTTAPQFSGNKVTGSVDFKSENPAVFGTVALLKGFGLLDPSLTLNLSPGSAIGEPRNSPPE